jgi:surfactin synthase thioesterase subunit
VADSVLICLPHGGAGASFFRGWQALAPAGTRVLPVRLPGREDRFTEPPLTEVTAVVDDAAAWLSGQLRDGERVVMFGHSLGAVLAYELAHRLATGAELSALVVSGSPDPWHGRENRLTGLPDVEFLAGLAELTGHTHPALADEEVRELVLPVLRADVTMHENYRPASDRPLDIPVTAVRGRDDSLVSAAAVAGWARATTGPFDTAELDGGHMYLVDDAEPLLTLIGAHPGVPTAH